MNRVLLFERDERVCQQIKSTLEANSYQVDTAGEVDAFIRLLSPAPQIALINLNIREDSGLSLLLHIQEHRLITAIIGLLETQEDQLLMDKARARCSAFLIKGKPGFYQGLVTLLTQLRQRLNSVLDTSESRQAITLEVLSSSRNKAIATSLRGPGGGLRLERFRLRGNTVRHISALDHRAQRINDRIEYGWNAPRWKKKSFQVLGDLSSAVTAEDIFSPALSFYREWHNRHADRDTDNDLSLVFGGGIEWLDLPVELLIDPVRGAGNHDYLALKHPLWRRVAGTKYRTQTAALSDRDRWGHEPLNILLIGANVEGSVSLDKRTNLVLDGLPEIDAEIEELDGYLVNKVEHLIGERRVLAGPNATRAEVVRAFNEDKTWHIVHFAGHGIYCAERPEQNALVLRPARRGDQPDLLRASELKSLIARRPPRLVCLNACEMMRVPLPVPDDAECYGVPGALLEAGIPHILGFRWKLEAEIGPRFALTFYRLLIEENMAVEHALLQTRRKLWEDFGDRSPVWASPILIAQH